MPLVLRSLVKLDDHGGRFRGDLVGGNGRPFAPAQVDTFEFDVPPGREALGVSLTFDGSPAGTEIRGYLIDPTGQALATHTTTFYDSSDQLVDSNALQANLATPRAGRWRFLVDVESVGGNALSTPYLGTVTLQAPRAKITGLPNSPGTLIKAGTRRTATISVRNDGPATEELWLDPRLPERQTYSLLQHGAKELPLPLRLGAAYLLPSQTDAVDVAVQATAPVTADWGFGWGAPVLGTISSGNSAAGHFAADELAPGQWYISPNLVGPFSGPQTGSASTAMVAHTKAFDREATTSTNDVWLQSIDSDAPFVDLVRLAPHQTGSMTVTFTPTGPPGRTVRGTLYVDDFDEWQGFGNDILEIPYTYTVG